MEYGNACSLDDAKSCTNQIPLWTALTKRLEHGEFHGLTWWARLSVWVDFRMDVITVRPFSTCWVNENTLTTITTIILVYSYHTNVIIIVDQSFKLHLFFCRIMEFTHSNILHSILRHHSSICHITHNTSHTIHIVTSSSQPTSSSPKTCQQFLRAPSSVAYPHPHYHSTPLQ